MKTLKIKLHSSVDLITNSSTVIFTYSGGSIKAVKDLVNEMLKVFGMEDKTFDDIFYAATFLEEDYEYMENNDSFPNDIGDEVEYLKTIKIQVLKGEIEKPDWMKDAESKSTWSGYNPSDTLEILTKDEKYDELANKLLKYLYSTDHEATRDG
jgi:hypothetical protein